MENGYDEAYGESLWYTFCIFNSFYIIGSCKVKKSDKERPNIHKQLNTHTHTHTQILISLEGITCLGKLKIMLVKIHLVIIAIDDMRGWCYDDGWYTQYSSKQVTWAHILSIFNFQNFNFL